MTKVSEMTNDELSECLAIEVMGWEYRKKYESYYRWVDSKNYELVCGKAEWNPAKDTNQTFECANKLCNNKGGRYWGIRISPYIDGYFAEFHSKQEEIFRACRNHPARALSEAVLMAKRNE